MTGPLTRGVRLLALAGPDEAARVTVCGPVRGRPGVSVEFPPGPVRPGSPTHHFICAMPGGVRIAFATRPG